jgi:5'-AMP-activated protein kinase catalytic alpha subunit
MSRSDKVRAKSIGHYILSKTIGEGTFGKVKLGTHILTGEKVAIKVLEKERIVDIADVERVAREIHILKLIRHPHIIQLYEIIETPRQLYLIMEFASGGELFDYIVAHQRVKEKEACRFFHQMLAGIEKIHEMNVVHRDLKPENLLLDENQHIKIVDFGLSNTYPEGTLLKTACGSPCYAAPEMIAGKHYVPSLCDVWSCGVILFALTCGFLPFEDQNTANLYKKILKGDYATPDFLSASVKNLISGILCTDPERRLRVGKRSDSLGTSIMSHPWMQQLSGNVCLQPVWSEQASSGHIDNDVLAQLEKLGFPEDYVVKCLQMNKHNHATTTYSCLKRSSTIAR